MSDNSGDSSSFEELLKELLQEVYVILLNSDIEDIEDIENIKLNEVINNHLLENNLIARNVLKIMTSNPQNTFNYSSLIGFFYQQGIGCKADKIKASEIFSNAVKNVKNKQFSFDQENTFCNNIKELNEMV